MTVHKPQRRPEAALGRSRGLEIIAPDSMRRGEAFWGAVSSTWVGAFDEGKTLQC